MIIVQAWSDASGARIARAGGDDFNFVPGQDLGERNEAGFVGNGGQRALNVYRDKIHEIRRRCNGKGHSPDRFCRHHQAALQPILLLGRFLLQQRNKTQMLIKLKVFGSGIGIDENWMLSSILHVSPGAENNNCPVCPANAEISTPQIV